DGCRINTPGVVEGNWRWRLLPGELTSKLAKDIRELTARYGRLNPRAPQPKKREAKEK
ncbi:MAG TPA: hypothetical protein IAB77_04110, partial [Candidatus Scatomorpha intestinavium]|nr:hypothetical protein [Candidatus Scatomorpha intestinavium]